MSKNELEKIFDSTPAKSYKDKIKQIEDYFISIADGKDVVGNGKEIIYPEDIWEYKHSFAEGLYFREMRMKKGQLGFSAIHKHSYGFFLLSGLLASSKEEGVEEFIAPCYVVASPGSKRVIYAMEDSIFVNIHKNPENIKDIEKLEKEIVSLTFEEYEEYINKNK